ncbi:hypothetical protein KQX54_013850 [Cotesia glomerata]|uniref:Uncharacterized protein n=1 Tax=Cotesia glomerata TaxID=32391 RepID=A0AAV7IY07_COTGL|nr:hypothetical protein KQX54_013850 [Cotesia glomerata]
MNRKSFGRFALYAWMEEGKARGTRWAGQPASSGRGEQDFSSRVSFTSICKSLVDKIWGRGETRNGLAKTHENKCIN